MRPTHTFHCTSSDDHDENTWLLVDRYFDALASHCAEATIPGWVDRLGGADVWTKENCFAMIQSLRID